jgi:hypothetical protein
MKILISYTAILILILLQSSAFSQTNDFAFRGIYGDRAGYIADVMNKELSLIGDQYSKVYETFLEHEIQRDLDFEKYKDNRSDFRNASIERKEKLINSLNRILNKDQMETFNLNWQRWQEKIRIKFGSRKFSGPNYRGKR